jgi:hypothetical protein
MVVGKPLSTGTFFLEGTAKALPQFLLDGENKYRVGPVF